MAGPDEWRCAVATVPPGHSAVFRLERAGRAVNGFVVNHDGHFRAYVNEFFTDDGRALICSTHGAVFEPIDGRCTAGPCVGDRLTPLPLELEGETLVVRLPAAAPGQ